MNPLLIEAIENLPPLPQTVIELRDYIDKSGANVSNFKIAEIIAKDPLLVAELLRLANSPFYGFSHKVSTIQQVVALLGVGNIKNIVLANSVKSKIHIDVKPYGLDTELFLQGCAKEVEFISKWLYQEDQKLANALIPCAMLLRLGMILLSSVLIDAKKDKDFLSENKLNHFQSINEVETKYCGVDSISFLSFLFNHWKFDEILIQSIAYINNPHAASNNIKKNAYALAIVHCLFEPYNPLSAFNVKKAVALINEANTQDTYFHLDSFIAKLPNEAREALKTNE